MTLLQSTEWKGDVEGFSNRSIKSNAIHEVSLSTEQCWTEGCVGWGVEGGISISSHRCCAAPAGRAMFVCFAPRVHAWFSAALCPLRVSNENQSIISGQRVH